MPSSSSPLAAGSGGGTVALRLKLADLDSEPPEPLRQHYWRETRWRRKCFTEWTFKWVCSYIATHPVGVGNLACRYQSVGLYVGGNDAESQTDDPIQQLLGTNTHGDGLSHKDFNFQEVLTTSTICGICRSKLATPSSEVRYLGTNTIEEELMLAIKDPLRADSVRGHDSALPVRCQKYPGSWAHLGSLCPL